MRAQPPGCAGTFREFPEFFLSRSRTPLNISMYDCCFLSDIFIAVLKAEGVLQSRECPWRTKSGSIAAVP